MQYPNIPGVQVTLHDLSSETPNFRSTPNPYLTVNYGVEKLTNPGFETATGTGSTVLVTEVARNNGIAIITAINTLEDGDIISITLATDTSFNVASAIVTRLSDIQFTFAQAGGNVITKPEATALVTTTTNLLPGWNEYPTTGTIVKEVSVFHTGANALKLTAGSGATTKVSQTIDPVVPRQTYKLSFWTKGDATNAGRYLVKDLYNDVDIVSLTSTGIVGVVYTLVEVVFVVPLTCDYLEITLQCPTTGYAYFDDISTKQVLYV